MEKVEFEILDIDDKFIESVTEQEDIKSTTDALTLRVVQNLMFKDHAMVMIRYKLKTSLQAHVYKRSASVDDGKISFSDYVTMRCGDLIKSMYRTRELYVIESLKENALLKVKLELAEKTLTYYAEEPHLVSIGYSADAIEALKAIRG